jgi:Ca-activated chloride channel homolog
MRHCNSALLAGASLAIVSIPALARGPLQAPAPTLLIPVTVTNQDNGIVAGLKQDAFRVYEESKEQQITTFAAGNESHSIGILVDLSGSMKTKLNAIKQSVARFVARGGQGDEFFLVGFNDHPVMMQDFTSSRNDILAGVAAMQTGHGTALLDAVHLGIERMKGARHERKVLLVISDGFDKGSHYGEGELRSELRKSDVEIYAMGIFDPYAATPQERTGPLQLNELCEDTGGRMFRVDDLSDMSNIAENISTELHYQYVIGYTPLDPRRDGKWRKVKVKLNPPQGQPRLTVHARTGYYAPLQ